MNRATPDFNEFLSGLRTFMKSQDEMTDYDFDGSALSFLAKALAYDATNQGFTNAMMFNEMHSTAQLRGNIGSLVSFMAYTPKSVVGAKIVVDVIIEPADVISAGPELVLTRFAKFSAAADGEVFPFVPAVDHTASLVDGQYHFRNVELTQGKRMTTTFDVEGNAIVPYVIPHRNVDTETLSVHVRNSATDATATEFVRYQDAFDLGVDKSLYFLSLNRDDRYYIELGDGVLSNATVDGNVVIAEYVIAGGAGANGLKKVVPTGSVDGYTNITVNIQAPSYGGSAAETADEIRYRAPISVWSGGSALNPRDYRELILDKVPNIADAISWSGDTHNPPRSGTEFVSALKSDGTPLTDQEKQFIVETVKRHNVGSIVVVVEDPDVVTIDVESKIKYIPSATSLKQSAIEAIATASIRQFSSNKLERFQSEFDFSEMSCIINDSDVAIGGNVTDVTFNKRFAPTLFYNASYTITYNFDLAPNSILIDGFDAEEGGGTLTTYLKDDGNGIVNMWIVDAAGMHAILKPIGTVNYATGSINLTSLRVTAVADEYVNIKAKSGDLNRNIEGQSGTFLKIGTINVTSTTRGK